MAERVDTVVIGGGQAGLATSYHLTRLGLEHVVLERGRVGQTWRSERWDGFVLNTPNWATRLPGGEYDGDDPDGFLPRDAVVEYLGEYATSIGAPVRAGVDVTLLRARPAGGYAVETADGQLEASSVVVATGAFQRPTRSAFAHALPRGLLQLHSSEYRNPGELPDGAVLVVGTGQSGCQIAEELLRAGRRVYLSVGRCPWFPRLLRGHDVVRWAIEAGLMDETVDALPSPQARLACNPAASGNDGGHDCNPRTLARDGAVLVGRVEGLEHGKLVLGAGLVEALAAGDQFVAFLRQRVDDHIRAHGLDEPEDGPGDDPDPVPEPPSELDLQASGIAAVLWANGYRPDF